MAESFGVDVDRYDRSRPPYPEALVERIVAASPGRRVLDVGCGTGIAARQFRAAGCDVLGVEPDERMATFARRTGIEVDVATFEAWDPAGRSFDAVIAAQAWHWVDAVAGAAKAAQVLPPGGLLAVFWHAVEPPTEVTDAMVTAFERLQPDSPIDLRAQSRPGAAAYRVLVDRAAERISDQGRFDTPERWRFDWERSYRRDAWLDQLATSGALTRLAPDSLSEVLEEVGAAVDASGGSIRVHYATLALVAARAAG